MAGAQGSAAPGRVAGAHVRQPEASHIPGVDAEDYENVVPFNRPLPERKAPQEDRADEDAARRQQFREQRDEAQRQTDEDQRAKAARASNRKSGLRRFAGKTTDGASALATGRWAGVSPAGLLLGFFAWGAGLNLLRGGPAGLKAWFEAKWLNKIPAQTVPKGKSKTT